MRGALVQGQFCARADRGGNDMTTVDDARSGVQMTIHPTLAAYQAPLARPVTGTIRIESLSAPAQRRGAQVVKRGFDIIFALLALACIAPIAATIALAIKLDSPGSVLYRQERVGKNGQKFNMIKFRSMSTTAEDELEELLRANQGAGPLFKMRDDPRVTRVGRVIRRYSLDELPQFWNVLFGHMSVVGPRPALEREVQKYNARELRRLCVKPGITGPWQVSGRSDLDWHSSVTLDLNYVDHWSPARDLEYIARTVAVVVKPKGAY
ncbi:MAG: exopolysaccharide biosynthesis polyprenyl glycosylphosphotransferase [Microbacterium sp.]